MRATSGREDWKFRESVFNGICLDTVAEYVADNIDVGELYGYDVLSEWAEDNGFVKEDA